MVGGGETESQQVRVQVRLGGNFVRRGCWFGMGWDTMGMGRVGDFAAQHSAGQREADIGLSIWEFVRILNKLEGGGCGTR